MKKLVSMLLAVCTCLSVSVMLTACDEEHTHTLTKVEAVAATCETAGNSEYYTCDCGKYFSDADGTTEITKDSWVLSATGHTYSDEWNYNSTHHWKEAACAHTTEEGEYAEHTLTNNECACGYAATTYTVTAEEWAEALRFDDKNCVLKRDMITPYGNQIETYSICEDKMHRYQTFTPTGSSDTTEYNYFYSKEDNEYFCYSWNTETLSYEKQSISEEQYTNTRKGYNLDVFLFSNATYDENTKSYRVADIIQGSSTITDVTMQFENRKLVLMTYTQVIGQQSATATFTASYNNANVALPAIN